MRFVVEMINMNVAANMVVEKVFVIAGCRKFNALQNPRKRDEDTSSLNESGSQPHQWYHE